MSRTLFISDLHLDTSRPATLQAFERFLLNARDCESLYILGDLVEAWVGDDDDTPLVQQITALLHDFSESGPQLFIMQGNRDFLLGDAFCESVGAQLLADPTVCNLYGTQTLLMHGDSLCTDDEEYQNFRRMARDPAWQAQMMSQSLDQRRELAIQLRTMSKDAGSNKAEDIMDVSEREVTRVMTEHKVDRLIHGHTHRPAIHQVEQGYRWVLGDWDVLGWYIEIRDNAIDLNNFHIKQ
jgi:UDP-2,3-diacylglucosamine hydrolase